MNPTYLMIIVTVVFLIFCIIGYYLYQETQFRKMVESTFNQKTDDILMHSNKKIVFEGEDRRLTVKLDGGEIIQRDLAVNVAKTEVKETLVKITPEKINTGFIDISEEKSINAKLTSLSIFDEVTFEEVKEPAVEIKSEEKSVENIPDDSVEAFFAKLDKIKFPFSDEIHAGLDYVVDIVFEEKIKIKTLLNIAQFTQKNFRFYVLDKNDDWNKFEAGKKYVISSLKLVLELVDRDGIINQAQIANIYNAMYKFAVEKNGHIRVSDYVVDLDRVRSLVGHIEDIELNLNLYLIAKDALSYKEVSTFLNKNGFVEASGIFSFIKDGVEVFTISDENNQALKLGNEYKLFSISTKLHLQKSPLNVIDTIFDFAEKFMQSFESRILTTNKLIFGEKEYQALIDYITEYMASSQKYGIELGGELLCRVY